MSDLNKSNIEKIRQDSEKNYDKVLLAVSSACLLFILNSFDKLKPLMNSDCNRCLLTISLLLFASSIILNLLSHLVAAKAGKLYLDDDTAKGSFYDNITNKINIINLLVFAFGLILLIILFLKGISC